MGVLGPRVRMIDIYNLVQNAPAGTRISLKFERSGYGLYLVNVIFLQIKKGYLTVDGPTMEEITRLISQYHWPDGKVKQPFTVTTTSLFVPEDFAYQLIPQWNMGLDEIHLIQ